MICLLYTSIPYVRAMKARKDASTEELYIQQMMRNEGKKFTEYECASTCCLFSPGEKLLDHRSKEFKERN